MCIKFIPTGRSTKATLVAPNAKANSPVPAPASFVTSAARGLKLGDSVKIGYTTLGKSTWMTSLARLKTAPVSESTGQSVSEQFVFVGAKKVRSSSGLRVTVVARRGSNMWTFQAPFEPAAEAASGSGSQSDVGAAVASSSRTLSQKIAEFTAGDVVALKYSTDNFKFVLNDISPYKMIAEGTLARTDERILRGKKYKRAFVKTAKINKVFIVPNMNTADGTDVGSLAASLESMTGQKASFTYYKQRGMMWLDSINAN